MADNGNIEAILGMRIKNSNIEYLVRYKEYPVKPDQWFLATDLKCDTLLNEFNSIINKRFPRNNAKSAKASQDHRRTFKSRCRNRSRKTSAARNSSYSTSSSSESSCNENTGNITKYLNNDYLY